MITRRFPRYKIDHPVSAVLYWDDLPIRKVSGRCRVLGLGGLAATVFHQFYIGEIVRLELPPAVKAYASVRNVRGTVYGFEFILLGEAERRAIKRLCDASTRPAPRLEPLA